MIRSCLLAMTLTFTCFSQQEIVVWGGSQGTQEYGINEVPDGYNFVQAVSATERILGLTDTGEVVCWGSNEQWHCFAPYNTTFSFIDASSRVAVGLTDDGTPFVWGNPGNQYGLNNVPDAKFSTIAVGNDHIIALKNDGQVIGWGYNIHGQCDPPEGDLFKAISAGKENTSFGIRLDGSIVGWGESGSDLNSIPQITTAIQISAGGQHCLALLEDGSAVGWGNNDWYQATIPPGQVFTQVEANAQQSAGLTPDGRILIWGRNQNGVMEVPASSKPYRSVDLSYQVGVALREIEAESNCRSDTNTDGLVDFLDVITVLNDWGPCSG